MARFIPSFQLWGTTSTEDTVEKTAEIELKEDRPNEDNQAKEQHQGILKRDPLGMRRSVSEQNLHLIREVGQKKKRRCSSTADDSESSEVRPLPHSLTQSALDQLGHRHFAKSPHRVFPIRSKQSAGFKIAASGASYQSFNDISTIGVSLPNVQPSVVVCAPNKG
ncbi:unnamed protein product [Bursaphelenchus okinawaensis]|uniref:Uncharacterized protein n=1 Tax=Bursaphelenchus okinawaensis TaxID=465554 RepID=A0A811KJF7_9BILA|nr:unnamed protein product [Bursaphelenchus okinawaensis]CAG9104506.1 unnamed protein product [Bursaphelenchus okinawaensis]